MVGSSAGLSDEQGVMEAARPALAGCIVQRMRVLRERIVHANFTCPLIRVDQGSADAQGKTQVSPELLGIYSANMLPEQAM